MDEDEWEAAANAHLDIREDCDLELRDAHCEPVEFYQELDRRYNHAKTAFPGMTVEEFVAYDEARNSPPRKRGRPTTPEHVKEKTPLSRAVQDTKRLREYWMKMRDLNSGSKPPLAPEEIAASRHNICGKDGLVDADIVAARIRRPANRH